jgi:hypothetical protein
MAALGRLLLRFLLVPLGYVVATMVGSLMMLLGSWKLGEADVANYITFAPVLAQMALATLILMWLPNLIGILISEALAVRSWMFHLCSGAVSAWIGWDRLGFLPHGEVLLDEVFVVIAAGFVWGLAYWAVAGSSAGFWKPVFRPKASPPPQIR